MLTVGQTLVKVPVAKAGGSGGECKIGVEETKIGSSAVLLLPWVGNGINYTESGGKDVLSGPFTGCIMGIYSVGGTRRVCHVATPECKDAWERVKTGAKLTKEFKPHEKLPQNTKDLGLTGGLVIYGYVTADERYYAVFCNEDKSRVLTIQKIVPA
jgi:hypothetical protein